jgi:hypothetical protein
VPAPRRRQLPVPQDIPWRELRRRSTAVFLVLQAGWDALTPAEREDVRRLVAKSRGRPTNLTREEARHLGALAGRAATSAVTRARRL